MVSCNDAMLTPHVFDYAYVVAHSPSVFITICMEAYDDAKGFMESDVKQAQYMGVTKLSMRPVKLQQLKTAIEARREKNIEYVSHPQLVQLL